MSSSIDSEWGIAAYDISWKVWALWFAVFAVFSAVFPRDAGFDVAHYHIHNGWSAVEGRLPRDMAPADLHSFLNPLHNALMWRLINALSGPVAMFIISPIQAALLPVTYALGVRLSERLDVRPSRIALLLAAFVGFLALPNQLMFSTLGNDHWGALAFLVALALLLPRDGKEVSVISLAVGSLLLGLSAGMKLTNIIYIIGYAAAVLCLAPSWRKRLHWAGICAAIGAVGLMLTGGAWAWQMWSTFGNPIFPNLGGMFPNASFAPDEPFRDERFLPAGLLDLFIRPFAFAVNGSLIYEFESADPRFLALYLVILGGLGYSVIYRLREKTWPLHAKLVMSLSAGVLAIFLVWSSVFSIIRYALALWVIAPIVLAVWLCWMMPERARLPRFQLILIVICVALFATTGPSHVRRVAWSSWAEPYVWVERPESVDLSGSVVVFATQFPTAFLAPAFEDAAWLTHTDSPPWSKPALANYRPMVREKLRASSAPVYVAMFWGQGSDGADLQRVAAEFDMRADIAQCRRLTTSFDIKRTDDDMYWVLCPVR
ncbi:MAG: hypothetical protein AAFV59_03140 [Pseudomonadota bacterium]